MAGECAVALAADVASHASMHLHVLLQGCLRLEAFPTEQAEDGHVRAWKKREMEGQPQKKGLARWAEGLHPQTAPSQASTPCVWDMDNL